MIIDRDECAPMMPTQGVLPVSFMPTNPMYANAYVPYQKDIRMFSEEEALMKGTAFVALWEPYSGNISGGSRLCPLL